MTISLADLFGVLLFTHRCKRQIHLLIVSSLLLIIQSSAFPLRLQSAKHFYRYQRRSSTRLPFLLLSHRPQLDELLQSISLPDQNNFHPTNIHIEALSGPGFCNQLYDIRLLDGAESGLQQRYVAKIFSDMAKDRRPTTDFSVDLMASREKLGPCIYHDTNDGILMEHLDGAILTERELHENELLATTLAHSLKRLHSLPIVKQQPNMLWHSLQVMMKGCMVPELREEYEYQHSLMKSSSHKQPLLECCGHGDMKSSNVVVLKSSPSSPSPNIRFIDFELSGRHYRGFDVAKLFRTDSVWSEDDFQFFCQNYCNGDKHDAESVQLEAELLMPLTWLEAAIFFDYAQRNDGNEDWTALLDSRMASYKKSIARQEDYVALSLRRNSAKFL